MRLFYKASEKELLLIRNRIFHDKCLPALKKNGFEQSPFSTAWFGKNNLGDFTYELCRVRIDSILEIVETHVSKGDKWIKVYLNIFKLSPDLRFLQQLQGVDGLQYHLPPNSLTKMRLRSDDIKGMPLLDYHFMFGGHKIRSYHTKTGYDREIRKLNNRIEKDLNNIDSFVERWHELHKPNLTDWKGNRLQD
ncbi:hypothetical protein [Aquiflexum gelatinilyticum]|uniref:Uncharacterized protein n=1 Tax=Aquiflexum gelatinilyticum TaxID=2961943 RepID=A0A9X2P2C7_9BACT|nr:hypothetical protein [Aquiflexum gelatinilyticum]MCR9014604.1 hypothetical protein [Aquiflexum gelatinilyticum]